MNDANQTAVAEKYKNQGNDQFKMKNFSKAIELYTQAISKLFLKFVLYSEL